MTRSGRVIAFLIPAWLPISGALIDTFEVCGETRRLDHIHGAEVGLYTAPGPRTYRHNDHFDNEEEVRPFRDLVGRLPALESLVVHIQPWPWEEFYGGLAVHAPLLRALPRLHVNVLGATRRPEQLASLLTLTPDVTMTVHHDCWAMQATADAYGVPVHHLSAWVDPGGYRRVAFADKDPVIAYSHDDRSALRPAVLDALRSGLPDYELVEVREMPYSDYKALIARARHVVSFGEGFDGYFVETVFSGGVPFAVYDHLFFPSPDYADYPSVYPDYETMAASIVADIAAFDDSARYEALNGELYRRLAKLYDRGERLAKIERFWRGDYDFVPTPESRPAWLAGVLAEKDAQIDSLTRTVSALLEDDAGDQVA